MKISDYIRLYQSYLTSLDVGGDKVGDRLARLNGFKSTPTIVDTLDDEITTCYGFKRFVDGLKFLKPKAHSYEGCNINDASGLKCCDYDTAYSQTKCGEDVYNARKIMTIGIKNDARITTLSHLHKIRVLYEKGYDFKDFTDEQFFNQEEEIVSSFLYFTKNIDDKEKRVGFRKEIICKPSNFARILGYDVICVDGDFSDFYPELADVSYVILNRGKACITKAEYDKFQEGYQKEISEPQISEK